jgi:hypothetical protein
MGKGPVNYVLFFLPLLFAYVYQFGYPTGEGGASF